MHLPEALEKRRSVRGYTSAEVSEDVLRAIFEQAQRAPSWCNIQPWRVWVTRGAATRRLVESITEMAKSGEPPHPDFPFPADYPEPYDEHRKACGKALYTAMGVERHDMQGRWEAWLRNFEAFGAPHVAIVGIDRRFSVYAAIDVGCWLQSVLLLATEQGVATCSQASLGTFPRAVRSVLPIPDEVGILFGISLGYEDDDIAANACRTTRSPLADNVTFLSE